MSYTISWVGVAPSSSVAQGWMANRCTTCELPSVSGTAILTTSSAERGKNREGHSFLEALRLLGHWSSQEFEGLVALWLEQCRKRMCIRVSLQRLCSCCAVTGTGDMSLFVSQADAMLRGASAGLRKRCGDTKI